MTDDVKASDLFKAERELRDFGRTMKAVIALADQLEEVGDLQKLAAQTKISLEALRKAEEEQRALTDGIKAENERIKMSVSANKQRVVVLGAEAKDAETRRDEAEQAARAARADLEAARAAYAELDALRDEATRERDQALRERTEAAAVHRDLTAKIATMKAQIAGLDAA